MSNTQDFIKLAQEGVIPESTLVKMSNFKDSLRTAKFEKIAKGGTAGLGTVLLTALGLGVGTSLAGSAFDAVAEKMLEKKKMPAFKKMLEYHPNLREEDPKVVARYFDSVWHFSPHMAMDPLAAGSYIRTALGFHGVSGGPTVNMTKDLTGLQKDVEGKKTDNFFNPSLNMISLPTAEI